jgi:hypothetical protein
MAAGAWMSRIRGRIPSFDCARRVHPIRPPLRRAGMPLWAGLAVSALVHLVLFAWVVPVAEGPGGAGMQGQGAEADGMRLVLLPPSTSSPSSPTDRPAGDGPVPLASRVTPMRPVPMRVRMRDRTRAEALPDPSGGGEADRRPNDSGAG